MELCKKDFKNQELDKRWQFTCAKDNVFEYFYETKDFVI